MSTWLFPFFRFKSHGTNGLSWDMRFHKKRNNKDKLKHKRPRAQTWPRTGMYSIKLWTSDENSHRLKIGIVSSSYAPNFEEADGAYWLCVHASVRLSVRSSRTVHSRFLKFHIWISHGKIAYTRLLFVCLLCFFFCPRYLLFWTPVMPVWKIRMKSDACHILRIVYARGLKFHIWSSHGKVADQCVLSWPSYLPFWSYAPLKNSEWNLVSKISWKVFELWAWNLVSW